MRVNPSAANNVSSTQTEQLKKSEQAAKTNKMRESADGVKGGAATSPSTKAELSGKAKEMATAHAAAASAPDVREDKIAALKRRIQEGTYEIDSEKIADRMVSDHMAL